jgi:hypothetical protein
MSVNPYRAAFDEAQAELRRVTEQFEELRKRKDRLEAAVHSLEQLMPSPQSKLPMDLPPRDDFFADLELTTRRTPTGTRKLAIEAIKKAGRPLTIPEVHRYMMSIMGGMTPQKESIRVLMIRRTDTFQKVGDGLYSLNEAYETLSRQDVNAEPA